MSYSNDVQSAGSTLGGAVPRVQRANVSVSTIESRLSGLIDSLRSTQAEAIKIAEFIDPRPVGLSGGDSKEPSPSSPLDRMDAMIGHAFQLLSSIDNRLGAIGSRVS